MRTHNITIIFTCLFVASACDSSKTFIAPKSGEESENSKSTKKPEAKSAKIKRPVESKSALSAARREPAFFQVDQQEAQAAKFLCTNSKTTSWQSIDNQDVRVETWSPTSSPLELDGTYVLSRGCLLRIEEGVEIHASEGTQFLIGVDSSGQCSDVERGNLQILGTENNPVKISLTSSFQEVSLAPFIQFTCNNEAEINEINHVRFDLSQPEGPLDMALIGVGDSSAIESIYDVQVNCSPGQYSALFQLFGEVRRFENISLNACDNLPRHILTGLKSVSNLQGSFESDGVFRIGLIDYLESAENIDAHFKYFPDSEYYSDGSLETWSLSSVDKLSSISVDPGVVFKMGFDELFYVGNRPISLIGTEELPIHLMASNLSWGGLFAQASLPSSLKMAYVELTGISGMGFNLDLSQVNIVDQSNGLPGLAFDCTGRACQVSLPFAVGRAYPASDWEKAAELEFQLNAIDNADDALDIYEETGNEYALAKAAVMLQRDSARFTPKEKATLLEQLVITIPDLASDDHRKTVAKSIAGLSDETLKTEDLDAYLDLVIEVMTRAETNSQIRSLLETGLKKLNNQSLLAFRDKLLDRTIFKQLPDGTVALAFSSDSDSPNDKERPIFMADSLKWSAKLFAGRDKVAADLLIQELRPIIQKPDTLTIDDLNRTWFTYALAAVGDAAVPSLMEIIRSVDAHGLNSTGQRDEAFQVADELWSRFNKGKKEEDFYQDYKWGQVGPFDSSRTIGFPERGTLGKSQILFDEWNLVYESQPQELVEFASECLTLQARQGNEVAIQAILSELSDIHGNWSVKWCLLDAIGNMGSAANRDDIKLAVMYWFSVTLKYDSSKFSQEGRAGFDLLQQKARMTRAIIEGKTNGEEWPSKGFFSSIGDFFSGLKNAIFGEDSPPEI